MNKNFATFSCRFTFTDGDVSIISRRLIFAVARYVMLMSKMMIARKKHFCKIIEDILHLSLLVIQSFTKQNYYS